jgi:EVE domain-containing protein
MPERERVTYWMIVTSPENYERTRRLRFTQQGVKSRHRRKAERMAPGDRVCWYLTGIQAFAATATITSSYFEGNETIWVSDGKKERGAAPPRRATPPALSVSRGAAARSSKTGDTYPWRFKIKKDHAVDPDRAVAAESLLAKLKFVKRWPTQHWRLAFQGNVHELDARDFDVIEAAIVAAAGRRSAA